MRERSSVCNAANVPFSVVLVLFVGENGKNLLYTTVAVVSIPPDVEKTRSQNKVFSISVRVCACVFVYMRL